jgi:hypothetical protein
MSHPLYLVQRLIDWVINSDSFYSFTYKLKERVDNSTRSFNSVLTLKVSTQHLILRTD